ncbi:MULTISPECIES: amino acid ABC transporter ATP-binding protein [unclassified Chelatococcus]|uniref:amino acid ABC transporter ATP-binding protein n=1 Tax=unclassified Chelatococcus TaxID=2638111 RepID=UPI00224BBD8F|nr:MULTISPECIES: amino acid ABC transporter ATP-binding protein [unclassified Chelatococcus]CAH1653516.1 L-glutamine ABC transporter ATP binding subunit [Hyphomicrobiales bacterium]CAH1694467.1 L-glutamine ABC transporter ATP binding subunit [Hyphomicrobiales bacterium]
MSVSQAAAADMAATGVVHARNVKKSFGPVEVLKDINLTVAAGEVVTLLGPSGSGKSTLLRCINHLEKIDAGLLLVHGEPIGYRIRDGRLVELDESQVCEQRVEVGMVFQNFNLFPHMTVLQNIIDAPVRVRGERKADAVAHAMDLLQRVGLLEKADAYPRTLSGGQQQRVAIARALAMKPKLLLFDEPTSALDPELVGEVLNVIEQVAATGITIMIVTHEIGFARKISHRVIFMADGQIVESGPPAQVIENPREARTRAFLAEVL